MDKTILFYHDGSMEKCELAKKKRETRELKLLQEKNRTIGATQLRSLNVKHSKKNRMLKRQLELKKKKFLSEELRVERAAVCIQRFARGWLCRLKSDGLFTNNIQLVMTEDLNSMFQGVLSTWAYTDSAPWAVNKISNWYKRKRFYLYVRRIQHVYSVLEQERQARLVQTIHKVLRKCICSYKVRAIKEEKRIKRRLRKIVEKLAILRIKKHINRNNFISLLSNIRKKKFKNRFKTQAKAKKQPVVEIQEKPASSSSSEHSRDSRTPRVEVKETEIFNFNLPVFQEYSSRTLKMLEMKKLAYDIKEVPDLPDKPLERCSEMKETTSTIAKKTVVSRNTRVIKSRYMFTTKPPISTYTNAYERKLETPKKKYRPVSADANFLQSTKASTLKIVMDVEEEIPKKTAKHVPGWGRFLAQTIAHNNKKQNKKVDFQKRWNYNTRPISAYIPSLGSSRESPKYPRTKYRNMSAFNITAEVQQSEVPQKRRASVIYSTDSVYSYYFNSFNI